MAFQIEWTIEGEKQLSRKLLGLDSSLRDYRVPFTDSAAFLQGVFSRDVFQTQGRAIGETWKRLSPYTVAQKARKGYPSTPLVGSGKMQNSFQTIVTSSQAVIYNTAGYFKYHQSKLPRERVPRRVMMKLADQQKERIVRYFQEYIRIALRKN